MEMPVMRFLLCLVALLSLTATAWAQTTVPNTFTAGTRASAAAVNQNFASLAEAYDDLVARVAKLEGQITAADIVGEYNISGLQHGLHGGTPNAVGVESLTWGGTMTFAANGTLTWDSVGNRNGIGLAVQSSGPPANVPILTGDLESEGGNEVASGTWSISASAVTLRINGNVTEFPVYFVANAQLFVVAGYNDDDHSNVILIGVRQQP
jgi:hypothetical protein